MKRALVFLLVLTEEFPTQGHNLHSVLSKCVPNFFDRLSMFRFTVGTLYDVVSLPTMQLLTRQQVSPDAGTVTQTTVPL